MEDSYTQPQDVQPDTVVVDTPPLHLPIDDNTLMAVMNDAERRGKIEKSRRQIDEKSKANIEFWKGQQIDNSRLDSRYQMAHVDNITHQDLEAQLKLVVSELPSIFTSPRTTEQYNMRFAKDIEKFIRSRVDNNMMKRLIKDGLRDMNLKYIGVIKPYWDASKNDFKFDLVDPKDMVFGEGSKIEHDGYSIDGSDVVFHYVEEATRVVMSKFPKKSTELKEALMATGKEIPSRIRYSEVHFRWYDTEGKVHEGVAWRYGNILLNKMKAPYYDYSNEENNFFKCPRKNFILMSYLNLGEGVYETTTPFEQAKPINRIINKRRRQITEIADRAVPKMVFSGSAMSKEQARNISPSPNEGIVLNEDVNDVREGIMTIPATPPNPILYNDILDLRGRIDSIFSTHGTTRGEGGSASGISKQISREGDMVTSDDIAQVVVERVVKEMAGWVFQFMRLFYDDDREPYQVTNASGEYESVKLNRETIETDISVSVYASTVDKTTRRADALQLLEAQSIDPYTLLEDLNVPNPKERVRRLIHWMKASQTAEFGEYLSTVGVKLDDKRADQRDAERDIEALIQGRLVEPDKMPNEAYVATFAAFVQGPDFQMLDPNAKMRINDFITKLRENVNKQIAMQGGPMQPQQPEGGQGLNPVGKRLNENPGGTPSQQTSQQYIQSPPTQATQPGLVGAPA